MGSGFRARSAGLEIQEWFSAAIYRLTVARMEGRSRFMKGIATLADMQATAVFRDAIVKGRWLLLVGRVFEACTAWFGFKSQGCSQGSQGIPGT